jgi:DDE superfamily endonuclease
MCNPADPAVQNAYYNRYKGSSCVTNVILFGADGCVCWCHLNCTGNRHDSSVAIELYPQLATIATSTPGKPWSVLADTAFRGDLRGKDGVMKVTSITSLLRLPTKKKAAAKRRRREIARGRVAAEWGMNTIKRVFARLQTLLRFDTAFNKQLLTIIIQMHNFRTRRIPRANQTRTVFLRELSELEQRSYMMEEARLARDLL